MRPRSSLEARREFHETRDGDERGATCEDASTSEGGIINIGFVGLGAMGHAMAENIVAAGHSLTVYNRTRSRAEALGKRGAKIADSAADAARGAEVVFSMLADDAAVVDATLGDRGVVSGLAKGAVHVSSSTISVALSERLAAAHAAAGQGYVAAPVFGRPEAAAAKQLWFVAAGPGAHLDRCAPIFEALGRGVSRLGEDAKAANVVKLAGNFIIGSMLETLGEAFALTRKSGIDPQAFADVYSNVFARAPIFEGYAKRIATDSYTPAGFSAVLGLKDIRFALAAAETAAVPMPIASLLRDQLLSAVAQGKGDSDWSVVARLTAERAGISKA